jgi:hypothetical protein
VDAGDEVVGDAGGLGEWSAEYNMAGVDGRGHIDDGAGEVAEEVVGVALGRAGVEQCAGTLEVDGAAVGAADGRVGESTHQGVAVAHTQERDFAGHAMGAAIWATAKEQAGADAGAKVDVQEIVDPGHGANAVLGEAGPVDVVVDKNGFPSIEPERGTKCWHGSGERGVGELANGVGPRVDGCGDGDRGGQAGRSGLATAPTNELAGVGDGTGQILVAGLDLVLTDDLAFVVEGAHCDVAAVERDAEAVAVVRVDVVEQWRAAAITGSLPDFDDDPVGEQALR